MYLLSQPTGASQNTYYIKSGGTVFWNYATINKNAEASNGNLRLSVKNGVSTGFTFFPQLFDLTAMFGSTIADYLYTLESGTAGAGVAKLKSWGFCTKTYYTYDTGSLLSVKTTAHKEYGFNAYNPDTGKAKVVGGQVYQITGTYTALSLNGTSIPPDASGYFTPSESGELTVTGGNSTTTCIHLKWDGERDGEWEPYFENTCALDDVELRGIPKLDSSNNLYYDGDSYKADGTVSRRFAIVNLGEKTWTEISMSNGRKGYKIPFSDLAGTPFGTLNNTWCDSILSNGKYYEIRQSESTWPAGSYVFSQSNGTFGASMLGFVTDGTYADAAAFKASMENVYLVYELATPATESAAPYQESQICNDFGTEEFVDERSLPMPAGHSAFYQNNLRAKLEMAPASPDGNGDYIVRQTNGLNEYIPLEKELPSKPTATGAYTLKCVVAGGVSALTWVEETT